MATMQGPEGITAAPHLERMDNSATNPATCHGTDMEPRGVDIAGPSHPRLPNPPFSFPACSEAPPSSASSSFARARGRRPLSAIESQTGSSALLDEDDGRQNRPTALPSFSFNPGASLPPDPHSALLSPPITPNTPRTMPSPSRPMGHGHRRGGSEFVGGRLREGNSISVMGMSPTKPGNDLASPTLAPPRRGHRRGMSSTISTNDLPILPPPMHSLQPGPKGGSAPTSPTNFENHGRIPVPLHADHPPTPETVTAFEDTRNSDNANYHVESQPTEAVSQQPKSATRARVGFSDTLEYIPRPLSLVSSDTSSTMTTKPNHSVSGSLSSIHPTSSPSGRGSPASLSRSPTREMRDSRPSTAGAILEGVQSTKPTGDLNTSPRRRNSIPALADIANGMAVDPPEPSPTKPKRWSFFGLDALTGSAPPAKHRPASSCSSDSTEKDGSFGSADDGASDSQSEGTAAEGGKRKKGKKSKRKRKMKGWAGAILPRKSKGQSKRSKVRSDRPPTPPPSGVQPDAGHAGEGADIFNSPFAFPATSKPAPQPAESPSVSKPASEDSTYKMIDLDAALGPFNTPLPHNPEWEAAQRAAGNTGKRRLHSAQGMRGFSGPGMHYHRRAESAPDLPPFDPGRLPINRFGSSSTMDDVFEEEEEEDEEDDSDVDPQAQPQSATTKGQRTEGDESDGETTPPAGLSKETFSSQSFGPTSHAGRRTSAVNSDRDQLGTQAVRAERSKTSLHEDVIMEEPFAPALPSNVLGERPASLNSSSASPKRLPYDGDSLPVDANPIYLPAAGLPLSPYAMSHGSSHPSPRSPVSVDAQRMSTAPSSIADDNHFQSLLMGEPGPEVRVSMDYDIPSLTSSTSTTTRESCYPHARIPQPMHRDQRPVSVSSAFGRRRSSLVSLSRLISSSHGERSKLSMEVTLDNDTESKRQKNSRTKRLGRMMQFWRPNKEGAEP